MDQNESLLDAESFRSACDTYLPLVLNRLERQFGSALDLHDLEDALSIGTMRAWNRRDRYDPAKSSLPTWLYMLARSAALDLLRARNRSLTFLAEYARDRPNLTSAGESDSSDPSSRISQLIEILERLPELDRTILFAWARDHGEGDWAANLGEHLGMPAATIRVRKLRLLKRVQSAVLDFPRTFQGARHVTNNPQDIVNEFREFVRAHRAELLQAFHASRTGAERGMQPENELGAMKRVWNQAIADGSIHEPVRRQHLDAALEWVQAVGETKDSYNREAAEICKQFSEHRGDAVPPRTASPASQVTPEPSPQNVQRTLAAISQSLIGNLTDRLIDRREAVGQIDWSSESVEFKWDDPEAARLSLKELVQRTVAGYVGLDSEVGRRLGEFILTGIRKGTISVPKLKHHGTPDQSESFFSWGLPPAAPTRSVSKGAAASSRLSAPRPFDLPPFQMPSDAELELWHRFAHVAEQLDKSFCAAALADEQSTPHAMRSSASAGRSHVDDLVQVMAEETGDPQLSRHFATAFLSLQEEKWPGDRRQRSEAEESMRQLSRKLTEWES